MDYSFSPDHAVKYGVDEAIVIKTLVFWIAKNKTDGRNRIDGRTWTFNTVDAWSAHFPFWTPKQMRRVLESLIEQKVLKTGSFNKRAMDRTLWYAFEDESIFLPGNINLPKWENEIDQMGTAIPDTNPDTNQEREPLTPRGESQDMFNTDQVTQEPKLSKADKLASEVLSYLNTKTGKKPGRGFDTVKKTGFAELVRRGKTFDDFKAVIDFKVSQWGNDPKMSSYLRPSTLFGGKFMEYLIEAESPTKATPLFTEYQTEGRSTVTDLDRRFMGLARK